jgi:hypothetical protein
MLQEWKLAHERRVELVTGIATNKRSHVLLYGANVGDHSAPLSYSETAPALFPNRYPSSDAPIELSTVNSSFVEKYPDFRTVEAKNLSRKFEMGVRERLATGMIDHLSVFSLAPQPLLILFGTMLGDIVPCDVYLRHSSSSIKPRPRIFWRSFSNSGLDARWYTKGLVSYGGNRRIFRPLGRLPLSSRVSDCLATPLALSEVLEI